LNEFTGDRQVKVLNRLIAAVLAMNSASAALAEPAAGLPAYRPKLDASIDFPAPERAARESGAFVPPHNVVMVTPGMTKPQIYTLLDVPHFHEGFNVNRWNYVLNFYTGNGDEYVACQYQIRFARGGRVEQTYFQDPECGRLLDSLLTPAPAAPVVVAADPTVPAMTYSFTFAFDSSEIDPQGHDVLRTAAAEIKNGGYREVIVTGFTDTMGSTEYNDALAARRAAAAANALRVEVGSVPVYARASRDLEVSTAAETRQRLNRQVQIELYATALDRPPPVTNR
jgi:outer membrane protein OmpA-like peptidoglycan-associated protein